MPSGASITSKRARPVRSAKSPIEKGRWAAKGTKPLPEQASVQHVLSLILVHGCRKVLFIQTEVKITLYSIGLFFGSLICDFLPLPKVYMAQKDNIFNLYFVKVAWAWMILVVGAFILLTSATIGCGHREVIRRHMSRLVVGTCLWYFWSQCFFGFIENRTGACLGRAIIRNKLDCNTGGFHWHSFDISGHAFLLVYINLFIVEEAKAIVGWEGIRDQIRIEDHNRGESQSDPNENKTPLEGLTGDEMCVLKMNYEQFTPYIRAIFCIMTILSVFSDVMLTCTIIFFHTMPQKVAGSAIAIATWFLTYKVWFKADASPGLPGLGVFQYQNLKEKAKEVPLRRRTSICKEHRDSLPTFMGMPLYGLKKEKEEKKKETEREDDKAGLEDMGDISDFRGFRNGPYGDSGSNRSWRR
ncbi:acyl-coenzyme A diphosphatase FITM2-like [Homarus americanus]|uniref:Fat storage-inducing transmembrane protein-like n=1 Tax=Homarus americanus TaxID=6706 RepID=A0A8J5K514_HOMAM|nr:acyl-coenzyme A diphosphatase FITM2-like [Homarus americanus]KAG7165069.1 Fat storage-inducing transmembrane protein-like [Homarus americanus]